MGTAGPLGLAREILDDGSGDPFFVLNRCEGAETPQTRCNACKCITWQHVAQPLQLHDHQLTLAYLCACSDVICEFPLKEMLAFHKERGAEGTLLVTKVSFGRC
jgi:mannose-1-phosphate guanylyltransferase